MNNGGYVIVKENSKILFEGEFLHFNQWLGNKFSIVNYDILFDISLGDKWPCRDGMVKAIYSIEESYRNNDNENDIFEIELIENTIEALHNRQDKERKM